MLSNNKFLGIIPARGGSKGIKNKNIVDVNGKPLIAYSILEAENSNYLDRVIVSTDSLEIASISKSLGADVPFLRPSTLANDKAKTIDVILHALKELKKQGETYDYVVILQPTQPLRKGWHIDEAIKRIIEGGIDSLVSVSEVSDHPLMIRTINKVGYLQNLLNEESTVRRQDLNRYYRVNGAIYINNVLKLDENTSLNDNRFPYVMHKDFDLDIDEPRDLEYFKFILRKI